MAQQHGLTWGALTFAGAGTVDPTDGWAIEAMADGTSFDNPEPLLEVVKSLLTDGSLAVLQGWDNREVSIRLKLSAADGQIAGPALAAAESALMGEVLADSKSPLTYVPPADESPTCVFDVVAAKLDRDTSDGWDFDEVKRGDRFYLLTLTCLPFARPVLPVTAPALAPPPATETSFTVDDGTSTTGWSVSSVGVGAVTRRNLVPNPTFATGLAWWTGTNVAVFAKSDANAAWFEPPVGGSAANIYMALALVTAGQPYTASAYLSRGGTGATGATVGVQFLNSSGGVLSQAHSAVVVPTVGSYTRASVTATAPAGTTTARLIVSGTFVAAAPQTVRVKETLLEQSASLGAYFDGSTATAGSTRYAWTGTAHASTSVAYTTPVVSAVSDVTATGTVISNSGTRSLMFTRTGAVSMTGTPYLRVTLAHWAEGAATYTPTFRVTSGGAARVVKPVAITHSSILFYHYYLETGAFDALEVEIAPTGQAAGAQVSMWVDNIDRTDTIVTNATPRQQARSATVVGSAPTQATVQLYDATPAALGNDILVYTSRNSGRQPNLRQRLTSTAGTTDSAMVSGARNTLGSAMVFRLAATSLTEGTYALMGRLNVTTAGTLTWSAKMVSSTGAATVGSARVVSGSTALAVTTGYQVLTLGSVALPVVAVEDDQMVELTLTGTANMTIDEAWLFGLDDGALTWVKDTDALTWIEIRSPELGAARPSVYGGTGVLGDNSVCIDWKCESFGAHRFDPGIMQVFTVTTTSLVSQSTLEFYPRYHSHVEDDAA